MCGPGGPVTRHRQARLRPGDAATSRATRLLAGHARAGLAAAFLAVVATGCMHRGGAPAAAVAAPVQPLPALARLYSDNGGSIQDSVRLVIRDPAQLAETWRQATSSQPAPPPVPNVDFSREMVLVAGAGRMTPTDEIHVDSVAVRRQTTPEGRTQEVLTAWVSIVQGCRHFQAAAYPFEIVKVRRFDGPVRFAVQRMRGAGCT